LLPLLIFLEERQVQINFAWPIFGLQFLDLSGFVPQILGSYPAQLSLNNSGTIYEIYYTTRGSP